MKKMLLATLEASQYCLSEIAYSKDKHKNVKTCLFITVSLSSCCVCHCGDRDGGAKEELQTQGLQCLCYAEQQLARKIER